jgi:hypothetical protein
MLSDRGGPHGRLDTGTAESLLRCRQHSEEFARAQISRRTWNEEDDAGFLEYLKRCGYQVNGNKVYCSPEEWRGFWADYSDSPGETGDG